MNTFKLAIYKKTGTIYLKVIETADLTVYDDLNQEIYLESPLYSHCFNTPGAISKLLSMEKIEKLSNLNIEISND